MAFDSDSGYVDSDKGQVFERLICTSDSAILDPDYCAGVAADTLPKPSDGRTPAVGKYYKTRLSDGSERIAYCQIFEPGGWESPFVFEIIRKEEVYTLGSWSMFTHGNWNCCWDGPMSGFYQSGKYFFLETCNTGSGFCASTAHFLSFPLRNEQEAFSEVPVYMHQWTPEGNELLYSHFRWSGDTLFGTYDHRMEAPVWNGDSMVGSKTVDSFSALVKYLPDVSGLYLKVLNPEALERIEID